MSCHEPQLLSASTFLLSNATGWDGQARHELRRLLPDATVESLFLRGNIIVRSPEPVGTVLDRLREADTRYLGHIIPVQVRLAIGPGARQVACIADAARLLTPADLTRSFCVRCVRRGMHDFGSPELTLAVADVFVDSSGPPVDLKRPEQVCSVEIFQEAVWLGMNAVEDLPVKTMRAGRKWAPGNRPVSRAEHKLREVLRYWDLRLPSEGRALDLGAAPGGWTRVLAGRVAEVVAVDPGELDERVLALPNVTHLRCHTDELDQDAIGRFDVIVNDMNMHPDASARLMCEVATLVEPGAPAVMTVKFFTPRWSRHVDEAMGILEREYEDIQVRRMPHNASETSLVMRRRAR